MQKPSTVSLEYACIYYVLLLRLLLVQVLRTYHMYRVMYRTESVICIGKTYPNPYSILSFAHFSIIKHPTLFDAIFAYACFPSLFYFWRLALGGPAKGTSFHIRKYIIIRILLKYFLFHVFSLYILLRVYDIWRKERKEKLESEYSVNMKKVCSCLFVCMFQSKMIQLQVHTCKYIHLDNS